MWPIKTIATLDKAAELQMKQLHVYNVPVISPSISDLHTGPDNSSYKLGETKISLGTDWSESGSMTKEIKGAMY